MIRVRRAPTVLVFVLLLAALGTVPGLVAAPAGAEEIFLSLIHI